MATGSRDERASVTAGSTMQRLQNTADAGAQGDVGRTVEIVDETSIQL